MIVQSTAFRRFPYTRLQPPIKKKSRHSRIFSSTSSHGSRRFCCCSHSILGQIQSCSVSIPSQLQPPSSSSPFIIHFSRVLVGFSHPSFPAKNLTLSGASSTTLRLSCCSPALARSQATISSCSCPRATTATTHRVKAITCEYAHYVRCEIGLRRHWTIFRKILFCF